MTAEIYEVFARKDHGEELKHVGSSISEHLRLHFPKGEEAKRYNVLQKLAYLVVVLVLLPLMLLTGLAMSPGMDAGYPILLDMFGGRQSARTIHFIAASLIVPFVLVHVVNRQSFNWSMEMHFPVALLGGLALVLVTLAVLTAVLSGREAMGMGPVRAVREDW